MKTFSIVLWLISTSASAQTVKASWYGGGEYLGAHTASGERFNPRALTAAHRSLPFGTRLRVTNLANNRSTIVSVNDRGPASWTGRSLDLTKAAAMQIGMLGSGEARVNIEVLK
jgi:rare lipoprotein A